MPDLGSSSINAESFHRSHFGSRYHTRADAVTQAFFLSVPVQTQLLSFILFFVSQQRIIECLAIRFTQNCIVFWF